MCLCVWVSVSVCMEEGEAILCVVVAGCGARPKVRSMTTDDSGRAAVAAGNGDGGKVFSVSGGRWDHCGLGLTAIHFGGFS